MTRFRLVLDRLLTDGLLILRAYDEPACCDCGLVWDGTLLRAAPQDVESVAELMEEARRLLDAGASLHDGGQGR